MSLQKERQNPPFNSRSLTYYLDGSKEQTESKEKAYNVIHSDPILYMDRPFDMTTQQARELCIQQIKRSVVVRRTMDPIFAEIFLRVMMSYDTSFYMRYGVHQGLFHITIKAQGTPEQWEQYSNDILNMKIIGCFAMTELGHSSFLRGLETTATYIKKTQEFIIHTPTLTGTKWWIGMAGQTATHTVALCNLVIDDKKYGLHWFVVPLRDPQNGRLLPGISAGDLGEKMGRPGLDSGWIQFTKVRIPRTAMLMKWAQLNQDGQYTPPPTPSISYLPLISERIGIITNTAQELSKCITIGVRYSCVRVQGENDLPIMEFQTHQYQLMPILATTFAVFFISRDLANSWKDTKFPENFQEMVQMGPQFQEFHGISSILKAWTGWWAMDAMEKIRRCMGGHAYSKYNVVNVISNDFAVFTTGGGDNIVLAQQGAQYLLSCLANARKGKAIPPMCHFFKEEKKILSNFPLHIQNKEDLLDPQVLRSAFWWLSLTMLTKASTKLGNNKSPLLWNQNMNFLVECTQPFCYLFILEGFLSAAQNVKDDKLQSILKKLCILFGLYHIEKMLSSFLQYGYINGQQAELIKEMVLSLCHEIRSVCVLLVDAFNYPDWFLYAPLGCYDGNVYEKYFNVIVNNPGSNSTPYWEKEIAPLTTAKL